MVEVATRKAYARELRSKEAKNVTPELKSILDEAGDIKSIVADAGSEFINKSMKAMLEAEHVELRLLDSFHEGDKVRVALKRKAFKKGSQVFGKALETTSGRVGYQLETNDGSLHVPRDLLKVSTVESREPARKAVPEATRLKKQKAAKLLKETADYLGMPEEKEERKTTRQKTGGMALKAQKFGKRAPRALAALGDYLGMPNKTNRE